MYRRGFSCTLYDVVLIYDQRMKRLKFAVILGAVDGGRGLVVNQNRINAHSFKFGYTLQRWTFHVSV